MRRQPSLTLRLSIYLLAGQMFCFTVTMIGEHLAPLLGPNPAAATAWNYLAEMRARHLVVASLRRSPDGETFIEPNAGLRALVEKHPTLRFAAFKPDTLAPLRGSSPDLTEALSGHSGIMTEEMRNFRVTQLLNGKLSGSYMSIDTPLGAYKIATHGYTFEWSDFFYHVAYDIWDVYQQSSFIIVMAIAIGWLTLKRGLAPLEEAARKARQIDIASLDQRIPLGRIPREIAPLVATINETLARLDAGVERQKRFLVNAAHELRTPLTIMNARINNPEKPTFKRDLSRDMRRLRNIVEQLLVYARLGRDAEPVDETFDLIELVQSLVDDYALVAVKNARGIAFETEAETLSMRGDRRAIESVIGNLIDNALRAEPEGGTVLIRVGKDGAIEVVDHGEGVAREDREAIFEPFWRKRDDAPGTGLGLAITRELVRAMKGAIAIVDTAGGGATFRLSFERT